MRGVAAMSVGGSVGSCEEDVGEEEFVVVGEDVN